MTSATDQEKEWQHAARVEIKVPPKPPSSKNLKGMEPIHPNLPQIPFYVGIIGPRHSGKSVLLFNLLGQDKGMYGHAFKKNNIIFFSPTKDKDDTLKSLKLKWVYGPPTDPALIVNYLQDQQKAHLDADNETGILLAFDDITQIRSAWGPLETLSYSGRHDHIHVIYVAHKMSSILRGVRTQTQQWLIYKPHEESERQWIMEMFARKRTWKVWEVALTRTWKIDYNFVYIDFECKEMDRIYRSGFNDPLFTAQETAFLEGDGNEIYKNLGIDLPDASEPSSPNSKQMSPEGRNKRCKKRKRKRPVSCEPTTKRIK